MKTIALTATFITALTTHTALAGHSDRYDTAKVTHVEPIYKTIEHRTPHRECWTKTVAYERPVHGHHRGHRSHTGTIVGAIIGGVIGNKIGGHHKRHKRVGTVAGAILGGSIGKDISHQNHHRHAQRVTEYKDVEQCKTHHTVEHEEKIVGYDVTYKYHGNTYNTRMNRHPGKRIKVTVDVRPVY